MRIFEVFQEKEATVIEWIKNSQETNELVGWSVWFDEDEKDALYYEMLSIVGMTDPYVLLNMLQTVVEDDVFEAYMKSATELWSIFFEQKDFIGAEELRANLVERYGLAYYLAETCVTFLDLED